MRSSQRRFGRFAAKPLPQKWEAIRRTIEAAVRHGIPDVLKYGRTAASILSQFRGTRLPKLLVFFCGLAPGDDLICTAALRELHRRGQTDIGIISDHPSLFFGNDDLRCVLPAYNTYDPHRPPYAVYRHFAKTAGSKFIRLEYAPFDGIDRSAAPPRHVIAEVCASAGLTGPVEIRPYLTLTDAEKASGSWARDRIIIQSSGMGARHRIGNKQWYPERFQQVVSALAKEHAFIQLGLPSDPPLKDAFDLRGKTTMREAAAVLHHARLYVGTVGLQMHLARAVECPSVIIFGGREAPTQSGYSCNFNLYTALSCAPCWRWNTCEIDRQCMREITAPDVINAIQQMLARPRGPLDIETVVIGATQPVQDDVLIPPQ